MAKNGQKWPKKAKMAKNGLKWLKMAPKNSKISKQYLCHSYDIPQLFYVGPNNKYLNISKLQIKKISPKPPTMSKIPKYAFFAFFCMNICILNK